MPNPNAFIAPVRGLAPAYDAAQIRRAEVDITVSLDGLPPLRLDPKDPRTPAYAEVLESLRQRSGLVYAETDPSTGRIQRLLNLRGTRIRGRSADHRSPLRPQFQGDGATEATRCSGHQCDLSFQIRHFKLPAMWPARLPCRPGHSSRRRRDPRRNA